MTSNWPSTETWVQERIGLLYPNPRAPESRDAWGLWLRAIPSSNREQTPEAWMGWHREVGQRMLELGYDPNLLDGSGRHALMQAVDLRRWHEALLLCELGCQRHLEQQTLHYVCVALTGAAAKRVEPGVLDFLQHACTFMRPGDWVKPLEGSGRVERNALDGCYGIDVQALRLLDTHGVPWHASGRLQPDQSCMAVIEENAARHNDGDRLAFMAHVRLREAVPEASDGRPSHRYRL